MTPAFIHGSSGRVYAAGYDLSPYLNAASGEMPEDIVDVTCFNSTDHSYGPGLGDQKLSFGGFFSNASATEIEARLRATLGVTGLWAWLPGGDAVGGVGLACQAKGSTYKRAGTTTDYVRVEADVQADTGSDFITSLFAATAVTAAVSGSTVDQGAASTAGGVGYLMCFSGSGSSSPTLTCKVQHSTDGSSWSDLVTFTVLALGAQPSAERIELASNATVNRYIRFRCSAVGGTSPSGLVWVGFCRR